MYNDLFATSKETKGTGVGLLKIGSKRRRTKQEITDEKDEALIKEEAIN